VVIYIGKVDIIKLIYMNCVIKSRHYIRKKVRNRKKGVYIVDLVTRLTNTVLYTIHLSQSLAVSKLIKRLFDRPSESLKVASGNSNSRDGRVSRTQWIGVMGWSYNTIYY